MSGKESKMLSLRWYQWFTAVQRTYFKPRFLGLDQMDLSKPALWVGNHTLYGVLDAPLLAHALMERGIRLYSLGDHSHFDVPVWRSLLTGGGVVRGTPENCAALMREGRHVLVFPGGGREVMKRKGENYTLIWKQRTGFARLAIEHGYEIQPFASLGADEAYDILVDANDVMKSPVWRWLAKSESVTGLTRNGEVIPPLVKGLGPTLVPRPQQFYFGFGSRIPTVDFQGHSQDSDTLMALREKVSVSIEKQLDILQRFREEDRKANWGRLRRWLAGEPRGAE